MATMNNVIYIKANQSIEISSRKVKLGDILSVECSDVNISRKIKTMEFLTMQERKKQRLVVSIIKIIECIHETFPDLEIQNLGATDIILTYEPEIAKNKLIELLKIAFVVVTSFVGAAFAIMTFNNDSGITKLFGDIFEWFMGYPKQGFSVLELTYSLGVVVGILLFFNHFGKKKFTVDPTPIEIEMRLYEKDIQDTLIEDYSRKGKELDVGKTNTHGNRGS